VSEPRFPYLEVTTPLARVDEVAALLFELGATGVEIRDESTLATSHGRAPEAGMALAVASFASAADADAAFTWLRENDPTLSAATGELVGDAWRDAYKEHFRPFHLTPTLVVVPPWESYQAAPHEGVLLMDPGRAFGTGLHATTALVAEILERRRAAFGGGLVLDVGTGSGILALAALLLGAAGARAIDNDPDAVAVARENAEKNQLGARIDVDATPLAALSGTFATVVANIESRILCSLHEDLRGRLAPGGLLVLSGILAADEHVMRQVFGASLRHLETTRRGDGPDAWVALAFELGR
jgi:ribosomal protein L11 methyltransferase